MSNPYDSESTPRPSHQISPSELRDRIPSFSTTSGISASGTADTFSTLAAHQADIVSQQTQIHDTIKRLGRSVQALSDSAIDPSQI